jgi:hypothetical protein
MPNSRKVTCPKCKVSTTYAECGRCGHRFRERWLTSMEERAKRLHVGAGKYVITPPTTRDIINRKA